MSVDLIAFRTENLPRLDNGLLALAIDAEVRKCALDCQDRPGNGTARTVTIKLHFVPKLDDAGMCDEVQFGADVISTCPKRTTKAYSLGVKGHGAAKGQLFFRELAPDNFRQQTLADSEE